VLLSPSPPLLLPLLPPPPLPLLPPPPLLLLPPPLPLLLGVAAKYRGWCLSLLPLAPQIAQESSKEKSRANWRAKAAKMRAASAPQSAL